MSEKTRKYIITGLGDYECTPDGGMNVWGTNAGDEYHTIEELYEHRFRLFLALVKIYDNYITPMDCRVRCWKTKLHEDGTMFEDMFLLGMTVIEPRTTFDPNEQDKTWDISYHLPMKYWHNARVAELERAPKFDGYTSADVLERLLRL